MSVLFGAIGSAKDPSFSKSVFVSSPGAAEDITVFFTPVALTITKITAILTGSASPSVTWTIRFGTDRSAAGTEAVTGGTTTTSVTTGSVVTSFNATAIAANSFIWLKTTAQSGTVTSLNVSVIYDLA